MVVVEVSPSPSPFDVEKSRVWNMGSICKCCGVCVWIVEIALGVFYRGPKSIPMAFGSSKAKKELVVIMEEALGNEQIFCHIILLSIILSSHTTRIRTRM